jgi:hypothetical protein
MVRRAVTPKTVRQNYYRSTPSSESDEILVPVR